MLSLIYNPSLMNQKSLVVIFLLALRFISSAQIDSLVNFDRSAIQHVIQAEGLPLPDQQQLIKRAERDYIKKRFKLGGASNSSDQIAPPLLFYGCGGSDFESDQAALITNSLQLAGWACTYGQNSSLTASIDNCNLSGCCPGSPFNSELCSGGAFGLLDFQIGNQYPIFSVFGGSPNQTGTGFNPQLPMPTFGDKFIRINDNLTLDYSIERITKTFTVTPANVLFAYAFIDVTQPAHSCCESSAFHFKVWNNTQNALISNLSYSISPPGPQCAGNTSIAFFEAFTGIPYVPSTSTAVTVYSRWNFRLLDLNPYLGQVLTIEVVSADCTLGGHLNKVYFDSQCWSLPVLANSSTATMVCGNSATLSAGIYLPGVTWQGPNNYTANGYVCVTNLPGTYTVSIPNAPYAPITRTIALSFFPSPAIAPATSTFCVNTPVTFSIQGMQTYTWTNGVVDNYNTILLNTPTKTIGVQGIDTNGCEFNETKIVSTLKGKVWTNITTTVICANQALVLQADSALSYAWNYGPTTAIISVQPNLNTLYVVSGTSYNGCPYSRSILVNVQACVDLPHTSEMTKVAIGPNPLKHSEILKLRSETAIHKVVMYNAIGEHLYTFSEQEIVEGFSPVSFSNGVYLLEIIYEDRNSEFFKLRIVD